jgi:hypothetical protein
MSESRDDSLSWEYFNMEKVVCDEREMYFHDEIEEMSEYMKFDAFFLSPTLSQHHMVLRWIGFLCDADTQPVKFHFIFVVSDGARHCLR